MNAEIALAENIVDIKFDDIPADVIEVTKRSILDTLGVMIAASTLEPKINKIIELVKDGGGKPESSIIVFSGKTVAWMAAFANGTMCHPLDYDDTADAAIVHPTGQTLPAALATAERVGGVTGADFITAVTLGIDLVTRLGLALNKGLFGYGWLRPAVLGYFSSAAAAGKLLGLSRDRMIDAFGLTLNQASGSLESVSKAGSDFRAIRDGFSAKGGVFSALLAQKGITGDKESIEGKCGLFNLYFQGDYDPKKLTAGLGTNFEGINVSFKPWPSCRNSHPFITAVLDIIGKHDILPENIQEVILHGGEFSRNLCEPSEEKRRPKKSIDAKVSLPFVIGAAIAKRKVVLADFTPEGLNDPLSLRMAEKITWKYENTFNISGIEPALVEIKVRSGEHYSKKVDFAYGHPKNPITRDDLLSKFRDCVRYSFNSMSEDKVEHLIKIIDELEEIRDMNQVIQLLS